MKEKIKSIIKYVPVIGIWVGVPFVKTLTVPVDEKTFAKKLNEEFVGLLYHILVITIICAILTLIHLQ